MPPGEPCGQKRESLAFASTQAPRKPTEEETRKIADEMTEPIRNSEPNPSNPTSAQDSRKTDLNGTLTIPKATAKRVHP